VSIAQRKEHQSPYLDLLRGIQEECWAYKSGARTTIQATSTHISPGGLLLKKKNGDYKKKSQEKVDRNLRLYGKEVLEWDIPCEECSIRWYAYFLQKPELYNDCVREKERRERDREELG
jgi:hypothetical protein